MSRKMRLSIITSLVSFLLSLVAAEIILRGIDPAGHYQYSIGVERHYRLMEPDPLGYTMPPGEHDFRKWHVTIDADGNRILPQRSSATCTLAFVGDSVTFGGGVNDTETFAYRIAEAMPDVQFVNPSKPGYNAENLLVNGQAVEADGQIYLSVYNDIEKSAFIREREDDEETIDLPVIVLATRRYIHAGRSSAGPPPIDPQWQEYLAEWLDNYPVLIFVYEQDGPLQPWLLDRYPEALLIDSFDDYVISKGDAHPSAEGHENLANDMLPHVRTFADEVCP